MKIPIKHKLNNCQCSVSSHNIMTLVKLNKKYDKWVKDRIKEKEREEKKINKTIKIIKKKTKKS